MLKNKPRWHLHVKQAHLIVCLPYLMSMESSNYLFIVICYFKMIPMGYIKYSASMQYAQFTYTFDHIM